MCGTPETGGDYFEQLRAILVPANPYLPAPWPSGPRVRWWDEMFAPVWDDQPPTVTPELSSEDWAAWHTRAPGYSYSPARTSAIRATVESLMGARIHAESGRA